MAFTYDSTTSRGRVRLLISDTTEATAIFQDDAIDAFLSLEGDSVRLAAALALDSIAVSEALIQKVQKTLDFETDGAKLATSLRESAKALREAEKNDPSGSFDIAENVYDSFSWRERRLKYWQRSGSVI